MNVVKSILEVIKKNMLSVICAVVAILACVAVWFWPLPTKFEDLTKKLNTKKAELASLETLATKTRHLPQIDPINPETPKLDHFPTTDLIKQGDAILEQITSESKAVQDMAEKLNHHTPLVAGSLPATSDPVGFEYVAAYQKMMEFQNPDVKKETLPIKVLHAGIPPSQEEIDAEKARRRKEINTRRVPGHNDADIDKLIAKMELNVTDDLKNEIASKSQMYMNSDALDIYPGVIGASKAPETTGWAPLVWYSQVGLWVQQDVCEALANANKSSRGVATSPVKHLIKIDVSEAASVPVPTAAPAEPGSTTGRKGNLTNHTASGTYDVIPFHLTIYVDAAKVPQVLTELAKNKFITVTKCDLSGVDVAQQALAGYFYGPRPVVMLSLDCEELFLKSWTTPLVPPTLTAPPAAAQ